MASPSYQCVCHDLPVSTTHVPILMGGLGFNLTTEAQTQTLMRTGGVFSGLGYAENGGTAGTFSFRSGGADGNQVITLTGSGIYQDSTHTDTVTAGSLCNLKANITAGSGSPHCSWSVCFAASGTTVTRVGGAGSRDFSSASTTTELGVGGSLTNKCSGDWAHSATLRYLQSYASGSTRSASTLQSVLNGAAGNQIATYPANTTGLIEDTTHTDSATADSAVSIQLTTGTGAGTLTIRNASMEMQNSFGIAYCGSAQTHTNGGTTDISAKDSLTGDKSQSSTENFQTQVGASGLAGQNLTTNVTANTRSVSSSTSLTKVGGAGPAQVCVVPANGGAALIRDTTHVDSLISTAVYFYTFTLPGSAGTTGTVTFGQNTEEITNGQPDTNIEAIDGLAYATLTKTVDTLAPITVVKAVDGLA